MVILREVKLERQTPYDIIYMWNLKLDTKNLSMKQKQTHRHGEQTCGCQGEVGRGMDWEVGLADANYYI